MEFRQPNKKYQNSGRPNQSRPTDGSSMKEITAPYNFVPLPAKVFSPKAMWIDQISHDVPFSDGISGELRCELETTSPVYVRNGGNWEPESIRVEREAQSFFNVNGQHLIPGTSLKGMLRSVIEIVSCGRMLGNQEEGVADRVADRRYAIRDLHNRPAYGTFMAVREGAAFRPLTKTGWLTMDHNTKEWFLTPCECARVEHSELEKYFKKAIDLRKRQSSKEKYEQWDRALDLNFTCGKEMEHDHSNGKKMKYRKAENLGGGSDQGIIVFTGQASANDGRPGKKHMEFIFFGQKAESHPVRRNLQEDFLFIHTAESGNPGVEWTFWEKKLKRGEKVPVFYLGEASAPKSMGLAQMYRLACDNTVGDAIRHAYTGANAGGRDLADAIFGYAGSASLKGRVSITPAVADPKTVKACQLEEVILGGPKPSYYPNYLEQPDPKKGYKTFMDSDCKIRGWKRYPARREDAFQVVRPTADQKKVATLFSPLGKGAKFTFSVKVHNLRPAELGAIIWALTWGGEEKYRHSLGMGKSIGYGQVKVSILFQELHDIKGTPMQAGAEPFISLMNKEVSGWKDSNQLKQLLAMANPEHEPKGSTQKEKLRHMRLDKQEFVTAKDRDNPLSLKPHA